MFQNEVKHVVLMPSSTNLGINKEVTHNTRQNNKIVGTQYREIQTTKVENFDPSLCRATWRVMRADIELAKRQILFQTPSFRRPIVKNLRSAILWHFVDSYERLHNIIT